MTWGELKRLLERHGWRAERSGKGSHLKLIHPKRAHPIWIAVHTSKEVGKGLAAKILKDAGIEP
jgi:predicted RNA binding protein YcfA (HicA-like mRNA interferase family)